MTDTEIKIDAWFSRYQEAKHAVEIWERQQQEWTDRATSMTKEISDMPRSASPNVLTDDAYAAKMDCADYAVDEVKRARNVMQKISQAITWVPDPICRDVMRYLYIDCLTALQTAGQMGMTEKYMFKLRHNAFKSYHVLESENGDVNMLPAAFFEDEKRISCTLYYTTNRGNM